MPDALKGMNELLNDLPVSDKGFELAKVSLKKDIETERVTRMVLYSPTWRPRTKGWIMTSAGTSMRRWIN